MKWMNTVAMECGGSAERRACPPRCFSVPLDQMAASCALSEVFMITVTLHPSVLMKAPHQ